MAKLLARLLATTELWVRIQTSLQNTKMGEWSKEWPTHSSPPKKYTKKECWMQRCIRNPWIACNADHVRFDRYTAIGELKWNQKMKVNFKISFTSRYPGQQGQFKPNFQAYLIWCYGTFKHFLWRMGMRRSTWVSITRGSWTVSQIHFAGFLDARITFEELHGSTKEIPYTKIGNPPHYIVIFLLVRESLSTWAAIVQNTEVKG